MSENCQAKALLNGVHHPFSSAAAGLLVFRSLLAEPNPEDCIFVWSMSMKPSEGHHGAACRPLRAAHVSQWHPAFKDAQQNAYI